MRLLVSIVLGVFSVCYVNGQRYYHHSSHHHHLHHHYHHDHRDGQCPRGAQCLPVFRCPGTGPWSTGHLGACAHWSFQHRQCCVANAPPPRTWFGGPHLPPDHAPKPPRRPYFVSPPPQDGPHPGTRQPSENPRGSGVQTGNGKSRSQKACQHYQEVQQKRNPEDWSGNQVKIRPAVVGGNKAADTEFPYMVAIGCILYGGSASSNLIWTCGGSLISERYVLTAAHCITDARKQSMQPAALRLGEKRLAQGARLRSDYGVEAERLHPRHDPRFKYHDLALLRTDRPVTASDAVRPVCLPEAGFTPGPQGHLVAAGWGATDASGFMYSEVLKKASLQIMPLNECKQFYKPNERIPHGLDKGMLCAFHPRREADTCSGDSGGPLVLQRGGEDILVGVTIFGGRPCGGTRPGVYASTAHELQWIESVVWP